MRLTDHTDYSIRVLMFLNQRHIVTSNELVSLNQLSEELRISKNNLIKASNQLAKKGFIESVRGRYGGLKIAANTGTKTLREIITQTEESFKLAECFKDRKGNCTFAKSCKFKRTLQRALESFLSSLENTTLNDITP